MHDISILASGIVDKESFISLLLLGIGFSPFPPISIFKFSDNSLSKSSFVGSFALLPLVLLSIFFIC